MEWLDDLKLIVEKKPMVVLRFDESEWERLSESRRGVNEFTIARSHEFLKGVKIPTACLIQGKSESGAHLYFALISSKRPITTLQSRIKVRLGMEIQPQKKLDLLRLLTEKTHKTSLKKRLQGQNPVVSLSPKLSSHLIDRFASIESNHVPMRIIAESLSISTLSQGTAALQEDAVRIALQAFGLTLDAQAHSLSQVGGQETALTRFGITEDSVIEHDARQIPGYELVQSDLTGRAIFEHGEERLEVFTANRRPLEHCFGVDLIYFNASKKNIVMLQYKMLEPSPKNSNSNDWIYRPDSKLDEEIQRMQKFVVDTLPKTKEYRLNPEIFYLKFVKRDGSLRRGNFITPLDHFEKLRKDPACLGPRGGLRVSYKSLQGRYLREAPFLDLLRAGYIGAYAETTKELMVLVDAVLKSNKAVVAAIQRPLTSV